MKKIMITYLVVLIITLVLLILFPPPFTGLDILRSILAGPC